MLLICVPLFLEMETVLSLWLGIDNGQTVLFSRLIVIYTIILVMNNPISIIISNKLFQTSPTPKITRL